MNLAGRRELEDGQTDRESAHRTQRTRRALQFAYWKQSIEKLKEKWTAFTKGIIWAIAEEEMKISREEFDKQIETCGGAAEPKRAIRLTFSVAPPP